MSMTVIRRKDTKTQRVFMHKVADIRGGVSVNVSELGDDFLPEGSVLSAPISGICHVLKVATLTAATLVSDTTIKVKKLHNFKAGDFVTVNAGNKAVAITAIDKSHATYDVLTVSEALGVLNQGSQLVQANAASLEGYYACESTDEGALKVVTADAADGQILKANVTPWRGEGSSPNANTYVVYRAADSALKYAPLALVGTGKPVSAGQNLDTDAWVIGVTKGNPLPDSVASSLKGIINY